MRFLFRKVTSRFTATILLLCVAIQLAACGKTLVLEPAEPLGDARAELAKMPGYDSGPFERILAEDVVLKVKGFDDVNLRVWYPRRDDAAPVIIFSHGNWSDVDRYDKVLAHWASYGFAVVAGRHLDGKSMARGIFNALRYGNDGLIAARVADVKFIIDHLDHIQALLPLSLDPERLAVAGHSFGAFTAQQFAGAQAITESGPVSAEDQRVKAVVALSPPGPMFDEITAQSWVQMHGPVLMTTGTHDVNAQFWPDWRLHKMSFDTALSDNQFALVTQGADHYLGNLICRPEREAEPQTDALNMLNAVTTNFLLAYVTGNQLTAAWLQSVDLNTLSDGFTSLERR